MGNRQPLPHTQNRDDFLSSSIENIDEIDEIDETAGLPLYGEDMGPIDILYYNTIARIYNTIYKYSKDKDKKNGLSPDNENKETTLLNYMLNPYKLPSISSHYRNPKIVIKTIELIATNCTKDTLNKTNKYGKNIFDSLFNNRPVIINRYGDLNIENWTDEQRYIIFAILLKRFEDLELLKQESPEIFKAITNCNLSPDVENKFKNLLRGMIFRKFNVIDNITVNVSKPDLDKLLGDKCSICLGECSDEKHMCDGILPCKHIYHNKCIDDWFKARKDLKLLYNCPKCDATNVSYEIFTINRIDGKKKKRSKSLTKRKKKSIKRKKSRS